MEKTLINKPNHNISYTMLKDILTYLLILPTILFSQQNRANLRFAWLSDTHVGSTNAAEDLSRSIKDINTFSDINFVILSGDITQSGKTSDLKLAKSILDSLKMPYFIIPGNHDTKWSESGATIFPRIWGDDRFVFENSGILFIGLHEGPLMRMADGHFAPEDLRWLDKVIDGIKERTQPIIFVTHYPVDNQIDNWYELIERAQKLNTQAILVGHGHSNRTLNFEGIPGIMGRSNLRAGKAVGGYNIVDIKNDTVYFSERTPQIETKPVWAKLTLGNKSYRPDYYINQKYNDVKERWKVETDYVIASAPAIWNDVVITGNSKGEVFGLSVKSGKRKWTFTTSAAVYSSPAVESNRVVFGSADSNIYCLNASNGKLIWKLKTGGPIVAAPGVDNGVAYIGSSEGKFRAINIKSGKIIWTYEGIEGFIETKPLVYGSRIIFGAWDSYLYALDKDKGSLLWKWSNGRTDILYSPAACWPVAANGKVFIVAPDRYMTAIDAESGRTVWRSNQHLVREAIGISEDGNTVYTRCMTDTILAFSSKADKPERLWLNNAGYGYDIDPSMTIEKQGTAFFGTKNGFVYAIDAKTGKINWVHRTGSGLVNTVLPLRNNKIIVSNMDGSIMLLEKE